MNPDPSAIDPILLRLRQTFLDGAGQKLDDLEESVSQIAQETVSLPEHSSKFRNDIHSLKGTAGTFGFSLISILCHKLEDLIAGDDDHLARQVDHIDHFLELMRDIINKRENPDEAETAVILAGLPTAADAAPAPIERGLDVLVVSPTRSLRELVAYLFNEAGCDTITVADPLEGFTRAIESKPSLVVSSMEMKHLSGIELGRALGAVSAMRGTRFALLSSSLNADGGDGPSPPIFPILRVNQIEDDIDQLLEHFGEGPHGGETA